MTKRQPKAVYEKARALHAEGKSIIAISFLVDLSEEQIRRAVDPDYAQAQSKKYARRNVLRRRGVSNPY